MISFLGLVLPFARRADASMEVGVERVVVVPVGVVHSRYLGCIWRGHRVSLRVGATLEHRADTGGVRAVVAHMAVAQLARRPVDLPRLAAPARPRRMIHQIVYAITEIPNPRRAPPAGITPPRQVT